ncbi:penicillin-binding protein 2 [bacterium]|nr:penicillin-binding protein 2 [bacterium]
MNKDLEFDKKLKKKVLKKPRVSKVAIPHMSGKEQLVKILNSAGKQEISAWNFLYIHIFAVLLFSVLFVSLVNLQIVKGEEMAERSEYNSIRINTVPSYRGIIFDRNGEKLVENVPAINIYINIDIFLNQQLEIDEEKLHYVSDILEDILGDKWLMVLEEDEHYLSIYEKVYSIYTSNPYLSNILLARDIDNDMSINIKSRGEELLGVVLEDESKRNYMYSQYFSHILGYVGEASSADIEEYEYISQNDTVGKLGVEQYYNELLAGTNGRQATEVNALGHSITGSSYTIEQELSGESLYLTLDAEVQEHLYKILSSSVKKSGAKGASVIVEDVNNGEILSMVSYPGYDTNKFIGGISQNNYNILLEDKRVPLLNRSIAAQVPPGSTFKTIVAAGALDAKAITTSTIYTSRQGYTFSSGATFQEYGNHSYGRLNIVQAIAKSSNIFFCETIRNWEMEELVPYLSTFGIGEYTEVDIPGEMPGRLPSPENKIYLAQHGSPWLDAVWYPEGDSCNSVIGQGITLVTPIQMANWMAAIANDGTLYRPHVTQKSVDEKGVEREISYEPLGTDIVSKQALAVVKEGMWSTVHSSMGSAGTLRSLGQEVAIKTGTAEFGALNAKGEYEHTHAWIAGFYPYDDPKYSFVIFLEDGGLSFDSLPYIKEVLHWLIENEYY